MSQLKITQPIQTLQFDALRSECLVVDGALDGGDYRLKLHRQPTPASGYKNKPLGADRLRVVAYGIFDVFTGYSRMLYRVTQGESAADALAALLDMLRARPLHGLPDTLCADHGPLLKDPAARTLLDRLGIALVVGDACHKERGWRTQLRRLEASLFLRDDDTIILSAMNAHCEQYQQRQGRQESP